jgi:hypothetical protein
MGYSIGLIVCWSVAGLIMTFLLSGSTQGVMGLSSGFEFVNPVFIYKNVRVNWFGAIALTVCYSLLCPIGTVCYWLYKLCTVGRK